MQHHDTKTPDKKSSFLSGVFLLTLSAVLVKLTGLVTKIPMLHLLGAQGMGYYNAAYEVYAALFVLSSAGLPVALSILISRAVSGRRRVFCIAMYLFAALGGIGGLSLWCGGDEIARWIGNAGAEASIRALAPAVLFVCLASGIRGYYQGLGDMAPTAISQVMEAAGKLIFGLLLAHFARRAGATVSHVAAAGAWGLSAGALLALLYLIARVSADFAAEGRMREDAIGVRAKAILSSQPILRPMCAIAVPITLSAAVTPLTRLLDMILILHRLRGNGCTEEVAGTLYGVYSTLAIPLYSLLPMMIGSLALPLVPGITAARGKGDLTAEREIVGTSLRLTCLLGVPASMGLSVFAAPILQLLFGGEDTAAAVLQAAPLMQVLGISVLGGCLITILGAMLQAYGCHRVPLWAMLMGSAVKLISAWILLGIPRVGMLGAPISTFLCHLTVLGIESAVLAQRIPPRILPNGFLSRTLFASVCSVGGVWVIRRTLVYYLGDRRLMILPLVLLCAMGYLCLSLRMGALRREDVVSLSHGRELWILLCRLKLVPSGERL